MKKILRSSITLIMATIFTLGLASCGNDKVETTNNSSESKEPVTINISQFKVEINDQLKDAIATYEAQNPNVKIKLETVGGGSDYKATLKSKFNSDITIFNIGGPQEVQDWLPKLEPLNDQPWVSQAVDGILEEVTVDGIVYGLPYNIEGYGMIYNKKIFEACGINGEDLDTFEKIEEAFATIQNKIDAGELKDQFPLLEAVVEYAAKETWVTGLHSSSPFISLEFSNSIDAFESPTVEFKYADAFKKYIDLQADYSPSRGTKSNLNAIDYATQVDGGIAIERVAVIQQGNWVYGGVAGIDPEVAENLGILPIPVEGVVEDCISIGVPMYWSINKEANEASKEAAKDFLNWLYQSDEGKDIIVNEFLFIPPFKNYGDINPQDSLGRAVKAYTDAGKASNWVMYGYPTDWGQSSLGAKIQGYYGGTLTWDEVVEQSKEEWALSRK